MQARGIQNVLRKVFVDKQRLYANFFFKTEKIHLKKGDFTIFKIAIKEENVTV